MPLFTATVTRTRIETTEVQIESPSLDQAYEDAEDKVLSLELENKNEWNLEEDDYEVTDMEEE